MFLSGKNFCLEEFAEKMINNKIFILTRVLFVVKFFMWTSITAGIILDLLFIGIIVLLSIVPHSSISRYSRWTNKTGTKMTIT
jgi:hypothetical protein